MSNWWDALSMLEKMLWIIAIPSTLVFTIQLFLSIIGGDSHDFHADPNIQESSGDSDSGFQIFSIKSVVAFLTFFGWTGITVIELGFVSIWAILAVSFLSGALMMFLAAWIMFMLIKLQHSGTLKMENAIGEIGEVYIPIPAKRKASGQIQVSVQGGLKTLDAVTEEPEDIPSGVLVEVIDVVNEGILLVRKKR